MEEKDLMRLADDGCPNADIEPAKSEPWGDLPVPENFNGSYRVVEIDWSEVDAIFAPMPVEPPGWAHVDEAGVSGELFDDPESTPSILWPCDHCRGWAGSFVDLIVYGHHRDCPHFNKDVKRGSMEASPQGREGEPAVSPVAPEEGREPGDPPGNYPDL